MYKSGTLLFFSHLYLCREKGGHMVNEYILELEKTITDKENLALIRSLSQKFVKEHSKDECWEFSGEAWKSEYFQVQEMAVFICGYIANTVEDAYVFLEKIVPTHTDWRIQEVLAMAFDSYCKSIGYENAMPNIQKWLNSKCDKNRRAVTEGLRVWTSRPYFKENPQIAISILSELREDESEYVRKSVGNALRDISKKNSELVKNELEKWDLSNKKELQVYKRAVKFLEKKELL